MRFKRMNVSSLEELYSYYNYNLFENILPNCTIKVEKPKGGALTLYQFIYEKHQITLSTEALKQPKINWHAMIVHDMVHLWQEAFGFPPYRERHYHNREWSEKLQSIGLMPTSTGVRGGNTTGYKIEQYPKRKGRFSNVFAGISSKCHEEIESDVLNRFMLKLDK